MRYLLSAVSLVLAVVCFALAIGQRTIWAPPPTITEQLQQAVDTPVLVLGGDVLAAHDMVTAHHVLPSRKPRTSPTRPRRHGVSRSIVAMRSFANVSAISIVGCTTIVGPGSWSMM